MGKSWEVQQGRGARILAGLGQDVRLRATFGGPTARLEAEAAEAEKAAEAIVDYGIQKTTADRRVVTSSSLFDQLLRSQQRHLAQAQIGRSLLEELHQLEGKNYLRTASYGGRDNLRVRVIPLIPDAVRWDSNEGWRNEPKSEMLSVGDAKEGRFGYNHLLISAPDLGGQLTMYDRTGHIFYRPAMVTGLVSPETGEPQVELEVLARTH
jgi:hypothetical protein